MSAPGPRVVAIVLTRDEAAEIGECLAALRFADARLVVDSGSRDRTVEIAEAEGARVVAHPFVDFASQRNAALDLVDAEWVLMIDADERVPPELAAEIRAAIASAPAEVGAFRLPRRNWYLGRPLRHCTTGRDTVVRLLRRGRARFVNKVHESARVEGEIRDLKTPLDHHTVRALGDSLRKVAEFSPLSAEEMLARGKTTSVAGIAAHTLARFLKVYVAKRGFLEGSRGFLIAGFESAGVFFKYAMLWDKQRNRNQGSASSVVTR